MRDVTIGVIAFLVLICTSAGLGDDAAPATIPPPPPEQFGYPGNIGPSRGWFVWHKYDPKTREVEVGRDPPGEASGETWKAQVIPWCTTYRLLSYGARPEELLPGERVNLFFNPDGKTKRGYVVHFQDELSQMRGHNHAWQITEVEPGDRWFRARLWMGNEKRLSDDEWSFWIDLDCEKWIGGKRGEMFPLKPDDHVWMTWVWANGQRVVKRITDAASIDTLKARQERQTKWRLIDDGFPGVVKEMTGTTAKLLLYSTYWSQARQLKPGQFVTLDAANRKGDLSGKLTAVKFGGTYGSGPIDVEMILDKPPDRKKTALFAPKAEFTLRPRWDEVESVVASSILYETALLPLKDWDSGGDYIGYVPSSDAVDLSRLPFRFVARLLSPKLPTFREEMLERTAYLQDPDARRRCAELVRSADLVRVPLGEIASANYSRNLDVEFAVSTVHGTIEKRRSGPNRLRDRVGNELLDCLDRVVVVDLHDRNIAPKSGKRSTAVDDGFLAKLGDLPDIEYLELQSTAVTNEGMKTVGALTSLQRLSVTLTDVDGRGMAHLAGLAELRRLSVASSKCTGEGFAALKPLTKLENLNFHSCLVNDAGLAEVGTLSSLERLEIVHTKFTDAGAKHLAGLTNLRRLQIGSRDATGAAVAPLKGLALRELDLHDGQATDEGLEHASQIGTLRILRVYGPVTDGGVAHLAKLTKLEQLALANAPITDAALKPLHGMKRLTNIDLTGCKLSDTAVSELKVAVPRVLVNR